MAMSSRHAVLPELAAFALALLAGAIIVVGAIFYSASGCGTEGMLGVILLSTPVLVAVLAYGLGRRLGLLPMGFSGGVLVSVVAAVMVPTLFGTIDTGRQKRSMADMRRIGQALEQIAQRQGALPGLVSVGALNDRYALDLPTHDAWCEGYDLLSGTGGYRIVSHGKGGNADRESLPGGATNDFDADIVFEGGRFTQWPEGQQR